MALAIDGSTPAVAIQSTGTVATVTTASFTPPGGSKLLELYAGNTVDPTSPSTPTITDSLGAHLTYTLSDFSARADTPAADGQAADWLAAVTAAAAMTITVTNQAASPNRHAALAAIVLTGASGVGAHGKSGSISASSIAQSYTSQGTGGWGFIAVVDWSAKGAMTAGSGCTLISSGNIGAPDISYGFFRRTTADGVAGNSNSLNVTLGGASTSVRWVYIEILPAADPYVVLRPPQLRDPGPAWWNQRDRRNANLVATAANPLVAPLDSAWQAGGRYWHLYNDFGRPGWQPQQRQATDPTLLTPAVTAVPFAAGRTVQTRDPGEVPWAQRRTSDVTLLAAAELENELLGGGTTAERAGTPATNAPRWWMPEQRTYYDPTLLNTALLENELLGSGTTAERAGTPATNAPRTWMPQQPKRDATTPGLLDTAQLEAPLVGVDRHGTWYTDRRVMPQQRGPLAPVDTPIVIDPLTVAWGAAGSYWHLYNTAADQTSRAWWPKQRPYLSDPSFYPTVAPTDPLTVAWGDGGTYWLLYNTAALQVDRRKVPQQRLYVSDPALLATALLEGPLLSIRPQQPRPAAASVLQPRPQPDPGLLTSLDSPLSYMPSRTWYPRPAGAGQQQRNGVVAGPDLVSPLLSVELARRYLQPATHADRRQTVRQPDRWNLYFSTPPAAVTDLRLFLSAPELRWLAGPPGSRWGADQIGERWAAGPTAGRWVLLDPDIHWPPGPGEV